MVMFFKLIMWNVLLFLVFSLIGCAKASVSYDSKAITINGQRRILISGSIHYPRSTPEVLLLLFLSNVLQGPHVFMFSSNGCLKVYSFLHSQLVGFPCFSDVARSYSEGQRWRSGCDSDLCVLEWTRTFTWQGNSKY